MMLNGELMYKAQRKDDAKKMSGLEGDEQIVYGIIKAAGTEGIWTKIIKAKSNLHQTVMTRCLKSLESNQLIKAVKSVKTPTRKIYMLFDLQPSIEVTGGPWFTDQELDVEFIERLCTAIYRFVESRSFPPKSVGIGKLYPADHSGFPNVSQITNWLRNSELTEVDLGISEVGNLLDVLVCDGKIEQQPDGTTYRAIRQSQVTRLDGFTEAPCGRCPAFMLCEEGSPVNPSGCRYFDEWLEEVM
ncbi:putative DNA-directed RNA polymerase III subunit rpc6 [Neolecta irregularis DAH-3]|uniref:DNA-directed RNA polymerase III subunit RPC6 n=1 Tax=Neolecta irregularis (strain DAH-3) TaxID=1198029 RepID=A0A1U7LLL6_NEOID|nr:putative DNA-directed RNA polymerase III subunit rpc6 [Neolecta irregularis DAH-3]|eukprot:OLL23528.1 putative DNA-directed RNA polymerase III subunit rpc6 [Neolecta irregularis DAH-3]